MAQHNDIISKQRNYTRVDFIALRYSLLGYDSEFILNQAYGDYDLEQRKIESSVELKRWLNEFRDYLIDRTSLANPYVAETLAQAKIKSKWPPQLLNYLVSEGEKGKAQPVLTDSISAWFKAIVAKPLQKEGINRLEDLKTYIEKRGPNWYLPIHGLGRGKAKVIETWFVQHETLGPLSSPAPVPSGEVVVLHPDVPETWRSLDFIQAIDSSFDGQQGHNRNSKFCLIRAHNDLEAIKAYLMRYRDKIPTYRAYQRELERFLLWCICVQRLPLSAVLIDECEAYKTFLAQPASDWCGPKVSKRSGRWKPFTGKLSPNSQRYAMLVLRTFFEWLVDVRYLAGNPWHVVKDPAIAQPLLPMALDKALPEDVWVQLATENGVLDQICAHYPPPEKVGPLVAKDPSAPAAQARLARAAILLLGLTGIRREEAAHATRNYLKPTRDPNLPEGSFELSVLGKRNKWRTVPVSPRTIRAIADHWQDRGHDFSFEMADLALLSPVVIPITKTSQSKHLVMGLNGIELTGNGFSPDGLYQVLKTTLIRLADDDTLALDTIARDILRRTATHAFRHTYATRAAAHKVSIESLQRALGHTSQTTTSIYINAEKTKMNKELAVLLV